MNRQSYVSVQAVYHAAQVHRMVSHQISAQQLRLRQSLRMRLALADRLIGELPKALISHIGAATSTRKVLISAERQAHVLQRRQLVSQIDADLAAGRLEEAVQGIRFIRWPPRKAGIYELVCEVESGHRRVLIAIKMVPAGQSRSGGDEWWIQTAHPLGRRKFRQLEAQGLLHKL
jgi:hypothetical protein